MALMSCSECGGEVSTKAPACVHCGNPLGVTDTGVVSSPEALPSTLESETTPSSGKLVEVRGDTVVLEGHRVVRTRDLRSVEKDFVTLEADNYSKYFLIFLGSASSLSSCGSFVSGTPLLAWGEFRVLLTESQAAVMFVIGVVVALVAWISRQKDQDLYHLRVGLVGGNSLVLAAKDAADAESAHRSLNQLLSANADAS